ncbi:hypothetical protein HBB16_19210 [Pseudonocardia sp. MCCB 268]|nr:hypothetical protein [Pseudonocardia cytotoxica]
MRRTRRPGRHPPRSAVAPSVLRSAARPVTTWRGRLLRTTAPGPRILRWRRRADTRAAHPATDGLPAPSRPRPRSSPRSARCSHRGRGSSRSGGDLSGAGCPRGGAGTGAGAGRASRRGPRPPATWHR